MKDRLSVIVAAGNPGAPWEKCLAALVGDAGPVDEIILVSNEALVADGARVVRAEGLVPVLWERGIRKAGGELVALLSADCVPAPGWAAAIRAAHDSDVAGVGGAITIAPESGIADRALHFCRYSRYLPPFRQRETADFAADNASYKMSALEDCVALRVEGFWEPAIHAEMIRRGGRLTVDPTIAVELRNSIGPGDFARQRFRHGRQFGRGRAAGMSAGGRAARVAAAPLIPLLMFARVAREVAKRPRHLASLALASPVLALFFCAWAAGECVGYLHPER